MASIEHHCILRPCQGEIVCGDATLVQPTSKGWLVAIIDALGHGPEASAIADRAESYLSKHATGDVEHDLYALDELLRGSRGAAAGLCTIDESTGVVCYAGIGNTVFRRFGSVETRLVSRDGTLGQTMRTPLLQKLQLVAGDVAVLYTDGVMDRFSLRDYGAILHHSPKDIVQTLISRFSKLHDDAGCIALRYRP